MSGDAPTEEELRAEAAAIREELVVTTEQLAQRLDVKARAHDKAEELKVTAQAKQPQLAIGAGVVVVLVVLRRVRKRRKARRLAGSAA